MELENLKIVSQTNSAGYILENGFQTHWKMEHIF